MNVRRQDKIGWKRRGRRDAAFTSLSRALRGHFETDRFSFPYDMGIIILSSIKVEVAVETLMRVLP